jgi:hypothetical protein
MRTHALRLMHPHALPADVDLVMHVAGITRV